MDLDPDDRRPATRRRMLALGRRLAWLAAVAVVCGLVSVAVTRSSPPATPRDAASAPPNTGPMVPPDGSEAEPDPAVAVLPQGRYLTSEICLAGGDERPVAVEVLGDGRIAVRGADGLNVPDADVRQLLPCTSAAGGQAQRVTAPGTLEQFGGSSIPLTDTTVLSVVAAFEPHDGEEPHVWVWFERRGVVHTGLVPLRQLGG